MSAPVDLGTSSSELLGGRVTSIKYTHRSVSPLIELIMVTVILGVLALGTTRYIVQSMEQYTESTDRAKLIAAGRIAVEKMTRRCNALPEACA